MAVTTMSATPWLLLLVLLCAVDPTKEEGGDDKPGRGDFFHDDESHGRPEKESRREGSLEGKEKSSHIWTSEEQTRLEHVKQKRKDLRANRDVSVKHNQQQEQEGQQNTGNQEQPQDGQHQDGEHAVDVDVEQLVWRRRNDLGRSAGDEDLYVVGRRNGKKPRVEKKQLLLNDNDQFHLADDGIQALEGVLKDRKLIVVSVSGPYRQGKSFFLNNLMGVHHHVRSDGVDASETKTQRTEGSTVGNSARAETNGIWMYYDLDDEVLVKRKTRGDRRQHGSSAEDKMDGVYLYERMDMSGGGGVDSRHGDGVGVETSGDDGDDDIVDRYTVVYLDTEGFDSPLVTEETNVKQCFFASAVSTIMFYNVMSELSLTNVRFLSTVAELDSYFIRRYNASLPSAPITWMVQSFDLHLKDLEDKGFQANAEGYLDYIAQERVLTSDDIGKEESSSLKRIQQYNQVIRYIRSRFTFQRPPRIFLVPPPDRSGKSRTDLPNLPYTSYTPEYRDTISEIRKFVRRRAVNLLHQRDQDGGEGEDERETGRMTGTTGYALVRTMRVLVDQLGDMSAVGTRLVMHLARTLAESSFRSYLSRAEKMFTLPMEYTAFTAQHAGIVRRAMNTFDSGTIGGSAKEENLVYRETLLSNITLHHSKLWKRNEDLVMRRCKDLQKLHMAAIGEFTTRSGFGFEAIQLFEQGVSNFTKEYREQCDPVRFCAESTQSDLPAPSPIFSLFPNPNKPPVPMSTPKAGEQQQHQQPQQEEQQQQQEQSQSSPSEQTHQQLQRREQELRFPASCGLLDLMEFHTGMVEKARNEVLDGEGKKMVETLQGFLGVSVFFLYLASHCTTSKWIKRPYQLLKNLFVVSLILSIPALKMLVFNVLCTHTGFCKAGAARDTVETYGVWILRVSLTFGYTIFSRLVALDPPPPSVTDEPLRDRITGALFRVAQQFRESLNAFLPVLFTHWPIMVVLLLLAIAVYRCCCCLVIGSSKAKTSPMLSSHQPSQHVYDSIVRLRSVGSGGPNSPGSARTRPIAADVTQSQSTEIEIDVEGRKDV